MDKRPVNGVLIKIFGGSDVFWRRGGDTFVFKVEITNVSIKNKEQW